MQRFLATMSNVEAPLAGALLGASLLNPFAANEALSFAANEALSGSLDPAALEAGNPTPTCGSADSAYELDQSLVIGVPCAADPRTLTEILEARAYLVETANPGYTMTRQGPELAIGRLHPEFVVRLANALREARDGGLPLAGIFSAYRPPAFGVGGFSDKFNSLHTYGLAVDLDGIGRPGSPEAQRWHEIAAKHGVVCPYGPRSRAEWNHCQATSLKIISTDNPLRETVTAAGPRSLESMFETGTSLIESPASAADAVTKYLLAPLTTASVRAIIPRPAAANDKRPAAANDKSTRKSLLALRRVVSKCARRAGCHQLK
jgi:hypothetical protein